MSKPWNPPTREAILDALRAADAPLTPGELGERLGVPPRHADAFEQRIVAMERDGQLLPNRKGVLMLASRLDLVAGRVVGHRDGFGFLIPDDQSGDIFLSPREMQKVMHGDRVLVRRTGTDPRGRTEGAIVEVAARARRELADLITALRSSPIAALADGPALIAALRIDAQDPRLNGLRVTLSATGDAPLSAPEAHALFRFVQEALNNVAKHSGAHGAQVRLQLESPVFVEVSDDGRGFDLASPASDSAHGLTGMRERAAEIGWACELHSTPGGGTRVRLFRPAPGGPIS